MKLSWRTVQDRIPEARVVRPKPEVPDFSEHYTALDSLLEQGEITAAECSRKKERLRHDSLMYIARTSGGYMPKTKSSSKRLTVDEQRELFRREKMEEITERVLNRLEKERAEAKASDTVETT